MGLKPQDILVGLKMATLTESEEWSYQGMSSVLGMSASEIHSSIKRLISSRLLEDFGNKMIAINPENFYEYICCGIKYHYPPVFSGHVNGVECSITIALPEVASLNKFGKVFEMDNQSLDISDDEIATSYVWPHSGSRKKGLGLIPLYKSVPTAAIKCRKIHKLLAIVEVLRTSQSRKSQAVYACEKHLKYLFFPDMKLATTAGIDADQSTRLMQAPN